jgi:hypothetical protein
MKIPTYDRQVGIKTPQEGIAEVKAPVVPDVLPAAYGANVGQATEAVGTKIVSEADKFGAYMLKQRELDMKVLKANATNLADTHIQEAMYDDTPEEYGIPDPVTGKYKTRPRGTMNQVGEEAEGGYSRTKQLTSDYVSKIASSLPAGIQAEWIQEYGSHANTIHESALKHEASQKRIGKAKDISASITNLTKNAAMAQTPEDLQAAVSKAGELADTQADILGMLPSERQKTKDEAQAAVAESSITTYLHKTRGDADGANLLLAQLNLPAATNTLLQGKIDTISKAEKSRVEYETKQKQLDGQADTIVDVALGKDSFLNPSLQLQERAAADPEGLGKILALVKESGAATKLKGAFEQDYTAETNNQGYADSIKQLASTKTLAELTKTGLEILIKNPKMDADLKASIAYYIEQKRAKVMQEHYDPLKDAIQKDPQQAAHDFGIVKIMQWADDTFQTQATKDQAIYRYEQAIAQKKTPKQAYDIAVDHTIRLEYPELSLAVDQGLIPNGVISKKGKANIFLPKESKAVSHKIWNPKTFKFEPNPNRKAESETTKQ